MDGRREGDLSLRLQGNGNPYPRLFTKPWSNIFDWLFWMMIIQGRDETQELEALLEEFGTRLKERRPNAHAKRGDLFLAISQCELIGSESLKDWWALHQISSLREQIGELRTEISI